MKAVDDFFQKTFVGKILQIIARFNFIHQRQGDAPRHPNSLPLGQIPTPPQETFGDFDFPFGDRINVGLKDGRFLHAPESRVRYRVGKSFLKSRCFARALTDDDRSGKHIADALVAAAHKNRNQPD